MDYDLIETPENVVLKRRLAGVGTRMIAALVDNIILGVVTLVLGLLFFGLAGLSFSFSDAGNIVMGAVAVFFILVSFLLYWGYFLYFEYRMNGQTPGKRSAKIRVVQNDGRPLTFASAAIRNLLRAVDGMGGYAVGLAVMFFTKKEQRLGDIAAGTVVVSEELNEYNPRTDNKKNSLQDEFEDAAPDLSGSVLVPSEYRLLHNYWIRREQLEAGSRGRILVKLLGPIVKRYGSAGLGLHEPLEENTAEQLEDAVEILLSEALRASPERPVQEEEPQADQDSAEDAVS